MADVRAVIMGLAFGLAAVPGHAAVPVCSAAMADAETPGGCFPPQLRRQLGGKVSVEVPPAHELFYIIMALTPTGQSNPGLIARDTPYWRAVMAHFSRWKGEPAVKAMEAMLSTDIASHMEPKINASAWRLTGAGRLEKLPQYSQIRGTADSFAPLVAEMERFARVSDFAGFTRSAVARDGYRAARQFYESEADLPAMSAWLRREFPAVPPYDHVRIVVSPLVQGWQHQDVVADRSFRELVLHVNYDPAPPPAGDPRATSLERAYILFTELNHGSINPMTDRHAAAIEAALGPRLAEFHGKVAQSEYATPLLLFREYLNWGLIPLYACDRLGPADCAAFEKLTLADMKARGEFPRYLEFQAFLSDLYRNRPAGTTLADLFPQIIDWFGKTPTQG